MELINTHCHTFYSRHGIGTVEEVLAQARVHGLKTLAFTEHFPLSKAVDPQDYLSMDAACVNDYLADIERGRELYPEIEIITGCELDYLGKDEDRTITEADLAPYKLIMGSVHFVDLWAFDDPAERDKWLQPGAADAIWKRYFELWCDAVTSKGPYHVMSHPDLAKKFGFYPSFNLQKLYDDAAEACASAGRMVEVNTSGGYYACAEMFPSPDLLKTFCRAGIPCTVGTDAHDPKNVARDIEKAYRYMYEAGYREVTVPTATGDRRRITIE